VGQQIADWLRQLGMDEYIQRFAENDIDFTILDDLTDFDLKEIGVVSLGHRRKLLRAIADLKEVDKSTPAVSVVAAPFLCIPVNRSDTVGAVGPTLNLGGIGAIYNLTMDPYEKYDMTFNGAVATRSTTTSPGRYAGMDNGWALALLQPVIIEFDKSIVDFPSIKRIPGGASNDQIPNLQNPANPAPLMDFTKPPRIKGGMED
jgi:SAM domain (Sterile alpha motif)